MYYKNADAIILIYDVQERQSFEDIFNYWLPEVESFASSDIVVCVLGNKIDLADKRVRTDEAQRELAERAHTKLSICTEMSIKEGTNIAAITTQLINHLVSRKLGRELQQQSANKDVRHHQGGRGRGRQTGLRKSEGVPVQKGRKKLLLSAGHSHGHWHLGSILSHGWFCGMVLLSL